MKTATIIIIVLLLAVWFIPNAIRVRKIIYIQNCMEKDYSRCHYLITEYGFSEVPAAVMRMKNCAEIVYVKDGTLRHNYLVNHSSLPYNVALNNLYKELKTKPTLDN